MDKSDNMNCLTLGSLFDGLGVWLISAKNNGIRPLWCSEIEKFPIEVTKYHHPEVVHYGDVTKIDGADVPPVDIITSGSPCQSFSIAGSRCGFEGESGLFSETTRIIKEMHDATEGQYPKFLCFENVSGITSSNKGLDFKRVLEEITEANIPMPKSGKWSQSGMVRSRRCDVSWRFLDAQYWGVPQRRRRLFLIADYRTIRERRPEVFFVSKSLQGDSEESRGKGEGTSCTASKCFAISGHIVGRDTGNGGNGLGVCEDVAYTLTTVDRHAVCQVKSDSIIHAGFNMKASKTQGISFQPELSPTLQASKEMGVLSYDMTHADDVIRENRTDKIHTLNHRMGTGGNQVPLVQIYGQGGYGGFGKGVSTLRSSGGDCGYGSENLVMDSCLYDTQTQIVGAVRKLTPLECERLMGLPDNYTLIPHKSCSDSARYKAIGNSMAVPCSDYIMWVVKEMYNNG